MKLLELAFITDLVDNLLKFVQSSFKVYPVITVAVACLILGLFSCILVVFSSYMCEKGKKFTINSVQAGPVGFGLEDRDVEPRSNLISDSELADLATQGTATQPIVNVKENTTQIHRRVKKIYLRNPDGSIIPVKVEMTAKARYVTSDGVHHQKHITEVTNYDESGRSLGTIGTEIIDENVKY